MYRQGRLGGDLLVEEDPMAAICLRKLCEESSKAR